MKLAVALAVLLMFAGCVDELAGEVEKAPIPGGFDLGVRGVVIAGEDQLCENDTDCAIIGTTCTRCDCGAPINRSRIVKYQRMLMEKCSDQEAGECTIMCKPRDPKCVGGICKG